MVSKSPFTSHATPVTASFVCASDSRNANTSPSTASAGKRNGGSLTRTTARLTTGPANGFHVSTIAAHDFPTLTASTTRLISRNRFRLPTLAARIAMLPMEPASLLMERKMLLGIKERAERLTADSL